MGDSTENNCDPGPYRGKKSDTIRVSASRSISKSPMPGFLVISSAKIRVRSGDVQNR
jgi:hypothetical protein